jgi:hypothetical protein
MYRIAGTASGGDWVERVMNMHKSLVIRLVFGGMLAFAVAATGCESTNGGGGTGGGGTGGTAVPGVVEATPATSTFISDLEVELAVTGPDAEGAIIYYTTDLTPVLDEDGEVQGTEYTDPIQLDATTVVKFLAQLADDSFSAEQSEGYTRTNGDSKREEWAKSGHGHLTAEAWRHWDEDAEVQASCARCHSSASNPGVGNSLGFLEYITTGGTANPAPLPLGLDCTACHERFPTVYSDLETYSYLEPVEFPSTTELSLWSPSNICMTCHQGRESGLDVKDEIADDGGMGPYNFINIHYYPAAATMFGGEADGGFQYAGMDYQPRNSFPSHPDDYSNCVGCHMRNAENGEAHTWQVGVSNCTGCHDEGDSFETLRGSPGQSYENIWGADGGSSGLVDDLYAAIQDYAENVCVVPPDSDLCGPITYDGHAYPYWFNDNGMGANYGNRYTNFDARLLAAAYNYQVGQKDPAGFIHNGTYIQQILYDSTTDLGGTTAVEVAGRGDLELNGANIGLASKSQQWHLSGHGSLDEEPFRHWDEADGGLVPGFCSKCHTAAGFAEFSTNQPTTDHYATRGVDCVACHSSPNLFSNTDTRYDDAVAAGGTQNLEPVLFPSGAELTLNNSGNLCMSCHQGRSSGSDVDDAESNGQNTYDSFDFINIHYYAAAAVLFGSDAAGGYEYENGLVYRDRNTFVGLHDTDGRELIDCVGCHMNSSDDPEQKAKHTFLPQEVGDCSFCHSGGPSFRDLNTAPRTNYFAIQSLSAQLLAAIEGYADVGGGLPQVSPVQYEGHSYPYWFHADEPPIYPNRYRDFDRTMLKAAYNYVVAAKDPAGYIHNGTYVQQLLWDSIVDLGVCPNLNPPPAGREDPPPTCP